MKASITILLDEQIGTISPLIHGHFAEHLGRCCNDGLWVGPDSPIENIGGLRLDVIKALRDLGVPILRWPGGCYADTYHWRDGIGSIESRPRTLGESCGIRVVEDNGLGTHEFVRLCREIGAEPYLAGNVGSGSPQEMMDWVHYCNGTLATTLVRERASNGHTESMRVRYWGVGNENWGCGGNYDPEDYAKEFRRYATFLRMADSDIELIACGDCNRDWNLRVIETLKDDLKFLDHLSVHQYWTAGPALDFNDEEYYRIMRAGDLVEEDIRFTDELLRFFTAGKREVGIAFDEWGVWHPEARRDCDYEAPNTQRDAVAAAGVVDVFHRWCNRISIANIAQIVNVLQTLVQTREDKMWLTPTYHLFQLYRPHRGATAIRTVIDSPERETESLASLKRGSLKILSASASQSNNQLILSLSNRHLTESIEVALDIRGSSIAEGSIQILAAEPAAQNTAENPDKVSPSTISYTGKNSITLPPCSVQTAIISLT